MPRTAMAVIPGSRESLIRRPARWSAGGHAPAQKAPTALYPWGDRPTLADVRAAAAWMSGFDAAPITVDGREGVAAVIPAEGKASRAGVAHVVVEGPDGRPIHASTPVAPGTGFADAVDMALMQYLASPDTGVRGVEGCLAAFSGDEGARESRIAKSISACPGGPALHAYLARQVAARVSRALRAARVSPRFRTGLLALDATRNREACLFRQDGQGDRIRSALVAYPLAGLHVAHWGAERDGIPGMVESLARDRPGFTFAHLRRIAGPDCLAWYRSAEDPKRRHWRLSAFFDLAAAVPPEWLPVDEAGLHAFDACASFLLPVRNASGEPLRRLVAPSRGDWHAFHAALTRDPWFEHLRSHVWFAAEDLGIRVLLPIVGDLVEPCPDPDAHLVGMDIYGIKEAIKAIARRALYGGKSAIGVLETAKRLYVLQTRIQARMPHGAYAPARWPALFETVVAPNGLRLVSLACAEDLADEGAEGTDRNGAAGLDHCVASNVPSAANGSSYFISVRRDLPGGGYERLSTVHLVLSERPGASDVYQHRGRANASPPAEAVEAVAWLEGQRPYAPWRAYHRHRALGSDRNLVGYECEYDWRDPRLVEAALDAWRPGLPRRLAGLDTAGLRAALGLDAALAPALDAKRQSRLRFTHAREGRS